jgi:hypothetical protein
VAASEAELAAAGLMTEEGITEEGLVKGGEFKLVWEKSNSLALLSCLVGDSGVTNGGGQPLGGLVDNAEIAGEFQIRFCFLWEQAWWPSMAVLFTASWSGEIKSVKNGFVGPKD